MDLIEEATILDAGLGLRGRGRDRNLISITSKASSSSPVEIQRLRSAR